MKRRLTALAIAAAFGGGAAPAFALDLIGALQLAGAIDPAVSSSRAQLAAVRERIAQARGVLMPQVNANASANLQWSDTSRTPSNDFDSRAISLAASLPVYRPANHVAVAQSELAARAAEVQLAQARQDLILRVAQAYFDVLIAQDSLASIRVQKRAIGEQFESAKRNFEVGTATITDQQEAQSRLDLTTAQEVAAQNDLEVRRAALAQLIGRPVGELDTLKPGIEVRPPEAAREGEWAAVARQQNNTVRQAEIAVENARREIDRQRYGHSPTVDVVSSLSSGYSTSTVGVRTAGALIGLQLSMPIYNGGTVAARVREAIALQERSEHDLESARRTAEQAARQTFLGVKSGVEQVRALTAAERSSQLALESNQLGYQVGVRISIDVLNAVQQLTATQRDLARARYEVLLNGLRLKNTVGDLTEEDLKPINALLQPPPAPAAAAQGSGPTVQPVQPPDVTSTPTETPPAAPAQPAPAAASPATRQGTTGTRPGTRPGTAGTIPGARTRPPGAPSR